MVLLWLFPPFFHFICAVLLCPWHLFFSNNSFSLDTFIHAQGFVFHISVDNSKNLYLQLKPLSRFQDPLSNRTLRSHLKLKISMIQFTFLLHILCQFLIYCFSAPNPLFTVFSVIIELDPVNISRFPVGSVLSFVRRVLKGTAGVRGSSCIAPSP